MRLSPQAVSRFLAVFWMAPVLMAAEGVLEVHPERVEILGPENSVQLRVDQILGGRRSDRTRLVRMSIVDPGVARVTGEGLVMPVSDGTTSLVIRTVGVTRMVPVVVRGVQEPLPVSFGHEVIPIMTKASCNSGGCHGKAEGQNGFKLSVFGFDPEADHAALVKEKRGGRVSPALPAESLLLTKGTGRVPHGGGRKLKLGGLRYRRLLRWIAEGARFEVSGRPSVSIHVEPRQRIVASNSTQQLQVLATDASGKTWCVTSEAEFESNNEVIAGVDSRGLVTASEVPGEAAILVRYMGHVAVSRIIRPQDHIEVARPPEQNFIDGHVWDRLTELRIPPSPLCSDATFLRRVHLDTIGTLPSVKEVRAFLADKRPDKRKQLVARLLDRPEYADYWTMKWADVLRVDNEKLSPQVTVATADAREHGLRPFRTRDCDRTG